MMAHSYKQWTMLPDDQLIALYDHEAPNVFIGLNFITAELTRRQEERRMGRMEKLNEQTAKQVSKLARLTEEGAEQEKAMVALTKITVRLTKYNFALTLANVLVAGLALFIAAQAGG